MSADELKAARSLADCCSRAGAFCGDGLYGTVERLVEERDYAKWDETRYLDALARADAAERELDQLRARLAASGGSA